MTLKDLLVCGAALTCSLYISLFPLLVVSCIRELLQGWRAAGARQARYGRVRSSDTAQSLAASSSFSMLPPGRNGLQSLKK